MGARISLLLAASSVVAPVLAAGVHHERILCLCGLNQFELYVADADGANQRAFLPGSGSNYNASFSADGQWIVFTSERSGKADIYRAHPDGTDIERLTDSAAYDDQGALSPDDSILAFVSTRDGGRANIWLQDLRTRQAVNLTHSTSGNFRPSWSPDGKWIAFTSDRDTAAGRATPQWELLQLAAIYIVHPDGSGMRRLTSLNEFSGSAKWSADGRRVVFYQVSNIRRTHGEQPVLPPQPQIVSIDITTGEQQVHSGGYVAHLSPQYIHYAQGEEIGYSMADANRLGISYSSDRKGFSVGENGFNTLSPSWSSDGSRLVYQKAVFTPPQWMKPVHSSDPGFELLQSTSFGFPAVSPDGGQIAVPNSGKLQLMNADGSDVHDLFVAREPDQQVLSVSWSHNGQSLAFDLGRSTRQAISPSQVAVMRPDGSGLRVLTRGVNNSAFPSLSPDGRRLVYRVLGSERGLRVIDLRSGTIKQLTSEWDNFPRWSPSGDRIVFTSLRTGDFEIFTIRPDGSGLHQLTHDHGNDGHPVWSPDGSRIAFASSRAGWKDEGMFFGGQAYGEIVVTRADGSGARQVTDDQWEEGPELWLPENRKWGK